MHLTPFGLKQTQCQNYENIRENISDDTIDIHVHWTGSFKIMHLVLKYPFEDNIQS